LAHHRAHVSRRSSPLWRWPAGSPGGKAEVGTLAEGNHHFQCCIHPWMRAVIKVKRED